MVMFTVIFALFGILMLIAAGVLIYFRRRQLRKVELMRGVETSTAAQVAGVSPGTLVEVKGTLRCESPLTSEMAGQTCAYYHSRVLREYTETERDSDGDLRTVRRSETIASNEQFAPFAVEDEWGAVGVRGEGAEVDAQQVLNRFDEEMGGRGCHYPRRGHGEPGRWRAHARLPLSREYPACRPACVRAGGCAGGRTDRGPCGG